MTSETSNKLTSSTPHTEETIAPPWAVYMAALHDYLLNYPKADLIPIKLPVSYVNEPLAGLEGWGPAPLPLYIQKTIP